MVLAFLSDPSNLWLDIFCSRYGFELFFTKEVPYFTLQDIFISGEVLVLVFLSDPSYLWLDIFCSRYGFFSFVLSLISTVCELFFTKEVPYFTLQDIFISGEVLVLAVLSDPYNLWLDIFCSRYGFFWFVLSLISTVCELFFTKEVPYFTLQDIFISGEVLVLAFLSHLSNLWLVYFVLDMAFFYLFCLWLQLFVNYSLLKKCLISHCKIFSFLVKYWY